MNILKWIALLVAMSAAIGTSSALFLWALDEVTQVRFANPWLLYFLPLAGLGIGWVYARYGKAVAGGNALMFGEINQPATGVPRRMAVLIFLSTLVTHLFGGSAGREGTALQVGGGIAAAFGKFLKQDPESVRILLMAGVAGGFGSVFGTPLAGAVFALEVVVWRSGNYKAILPCLFVSLLADWTCDRWGIQHTHYRVGDSMFTFGIVVKVLIAALAFGLASWLFVRISEQATALFKRWIPQSEWRPLVGGVIVIALFLLTGKSDYLGLGVLAEHAGSVTLPSLFTSVDIPHSSWVWKLVFTVVTLSAGFKGGEATPLFFIGAALGNSLAIAMGAPVDLFAALGFIAIFAAATKTPVASTVLGLELFGLGNGIYFVIACILAHRCSGKRGIYMPPTTEHNGHK